MLAIILARPLTSALAALALVFAVLAGVQGWRASRLKGELSEAKAAELGAKIQATLSDRVLRIEDRRHTLGRLKRPHPA